MQVDTNLSQWESIPGNQGRRDVMGGFIEYAFQRFVVHHNFKRYSIQEQVKLLVPKITR